MFNLRQHLNTPDFVMSDSRDTSPIHFKQNKAYCHKEDKITFKTIKFQATFCDRIRQKVTKFIESTGNKRPCYQCQLFLKKKKFMNAIRPNLQSLREKIFFFRPFIKSNNIMIDIILKT